ALLDGAEIGQGAAQPALVDERHAGTDRFLGHDLLRLPLGADEEDVASFRGDAADVIERLPEARGGLLEVDDVDPIALPEDELAHLGVPALRLVSEVDTRLQELLDVDRRQIILLVPALSGAGLSKKSPLRELEPGARALLA